MQDDEFRINNQRLHLIYRDHLPKADYKKWLKNKGGFNECILAHETADDEVPYYHTHVLIDFGYPKQTRNPSYFDYDGIAPEMIIRVNSKQHYDNTKKYLAKEDPDNEEYGLTHVQKIWRCESEEEAITRYAKNANQVYSVRQAWAVKPRPKVERKCEMYSWQAKAIEELSEIPDIRKITWYWDEKGGAGKSSLANQLITTDPKKCLLLKTLSDLRDTSNTLLNAWNKGWDGHCVFFDIARNMDYDELNIYEVLEMVKDGVITNTKYQCETFVLPYSLMSWCSLTDFQTWK
jgi:hypothetical protein